MRPDDITADMVRQTLGAIRSARSLAGSPLLGLNALAATSTSLSTTDSPAARAIILRGWLEGIAWEQLSRLRGEPVAAAARPPGPAEALGDLATDFRAVSADREAWGILYFHYFSGSSATRGQVAATIAVGYNTVRRRLERGYELLAIELRERERLAAMLTERAHNVPRPPSRFIGREAELGAIRALMASHRLVVLTGLGGIGKSRLAIHLAQDLAADYPDGSWFVELATVLDGRHVPQAVLGAMGQREVPGQTLLDTLTAVLAERRMLLVLDNCEQVAAACTELLDHLLSRCPALEVLATSREQLPVAGAAHWPVPPLALPAAESEATVGALIHFDGPRLFSTRAAVAVPDFALTDATAGPVGRICAQLDGIPLALEMAAGRLGELSLARIEAGLADRFGLLLDGRRASRPGHETLRATMDWSYELLSEPERRLFQRLAVFRGGCTPDAAAAVCAAEDGLNCGDFPGVLDLLAAKSLQYVREADEPARYRMLETVRLYAWDRLQAEGAPDYWRDRHMGYYEAWAADMAECILEPYRMDRKPGVAAELDNFREAMRWAIERPAATKGARIASTLLPLWTSLGLEVEGREWLERFLAHQDVDWPVGPLADARYALGQLMLRQSNLARALENLDRARELYLAAGNPIGAAACDVSAGEILDRQGNRAAARERLAVGRAACLAAGYQCGVADAGSILGVISREGDGGIAPLDYLAESESIYRELGDERGLATTLNNRGFYFLIRGREAEARAELDRALAAWRKLADRMELYNTLSNLSEVCLSQGDNVSARMYASESLHLARQGGSRVQTGACQRLLANIAAAEGDDESACRHAAVAVQIGQQEGVPGQYSNSLLTLISAELRLGRLEEARAHIDEGLQWCADGGKILSGSQFLAREGWLYTIQRSFDAARQSLARGLQIVADTGAEQGVRFCIERFIALAAAEGRACRAVTLAGMADGRRRADGATLPSRFAAEVATLLEPPREELGLERAGEAFALGRAATRDEAIAYALGELTWDELRAAVAARAAAGTPGRTP